MELNEPRELIDSPEKLEAILNKRKLTQENKALIVQSFNFLFDRSKLATYDGLTGLLRKEVFGDLLSRMIQFAARGNTNLSLLYLDIDHFKRINDDYGHAVGDCVLKEFSSQVQKTLRAYDLVGRIGEEKVRKPGEENVGRIGGEEFAAILPVSLEETVKVAERLRRNVEQNCKFYVRGENDVVKMNETAEPVDKYDSEKIINLTVSIGVAPFDSSLMKDKDQFCAKADRALYDAKHTGRNKVVVYKPSQSTSSK